MTTAERADDVAEVRRVLHGGDRTAPGTLYSHSVRRKAVVVGFGLLILALPAHAAQEAGTKAMTIRLVSTTTSFRLLVDRPPKGSLSKGDVQWAKSTLTNVVPQFGRPKDAVVGSDVATLTVGAPGQARLKGTAKLPGGTIRIAALVVSGLAPARISIVGGTGAFASARGTVEVRSLNASGTRALNVYRLRLP